MGKISIDAPFEQVARLVADPARAHEWGTSFFSGPLRRADGDEWVATVPMMGGEIRYRHEADVERCIMDVYLAEHSRYLDGLLEALGVRSGVTLVVHDWDSALGGGV